MADNGVVHLTTSPWAGSPRFSDTTAGYSGVALETHAGGRPLWIRPTSKWIARYPKRANSAGDLDRGADRMAMSHASRPGGTHKLIYLELQPDMVRA